MPSTRGSTLPSPHCRRMPPHTSGVHHKRRQLSRLRAPIPDSGVATRHRASLAVVAARVTLRATLCVQHSACNTDRQNVARATSRPLRLPPSATPLVAHQKVESCAGPVGRDGDAATPPPNMAVTTAAGLKWPVHAAFFSWLRDATRNVATASLCHDLAHILPSSLDDTTTTSQDSSP